MDEQKKTKKNPCYCTAVLGALVIAFAWLKVSWGAIALTILGIVIIIKTFVDSCCCQDGACKSQK